MCHNEINHKINVCFSRYSSKILFIISKKSFLHFKDYESMIKVNQRCEQLSEIAPKINNHMMISYLTAFARSR
jgi:hypothetical protein